MPTITKKRLFLWLRSTSYVKMIMQLQVAKKQVEDGGIIYAPNL